ncbi:hypothetical protein [Butyrivibrio sp. M55]|uniref:hypothetical protein n=1 Tax=Butyrivibrio sp. M55 TaxID=1855323 RepID=UPI0008E9A49B|nr:hypothetical protein [Butyrivibrio sp. M55]SFU89723.1 hypothetical protein SAMN05216540_11855 [Butyrivibrio sp. M55]
MTLINKETFDILESINFEALQEFKCEMDINPDDYFECDEEIAPIICLLNKKGYLTKYCCQGHLYDSINAAVFKIDNIDEIYKGVPGVLSIDNAKDGKVSVAFRQQVHYDLYILFEDASVLPTPPEGFSLKGNTLESVLFPENIECNEKYMQDKPYEYFEKKLSVFKVLYEWVQSLPNLKEN